jgi:hypothetical protein
MEYQPTEEMLYCPWLDFEDVKILRKAIRREFFIYSDQSSLA